MQDTDLPTLLPALEATTAGGHAGEGLVPFLETMPAAFCFLDARWRFGYERRGRAAHGPVARPARRSVALGHLPRVRGTVFESTCRSAAATGQPQTFESSFPGARVGWFVAQLCALADRPLDELCDALLEGMLCGTPRDDVALVALRLAG